MKFSGRRTLSVIAVAAAAVALAACGKKEAASDAQVIKIGHVGPVSGAIAHLGKDNENGARMAIDDLNAQGVMIGLYIVAFETGPGALVFAAGLAVVAALYVWTGVSRVTVPDHVRLAPSRSLTVRASALPGTGEDSTIV